MTPRDGHSVVQISVTPIVSKKVQNASSRDLTNQPLSFKGANMIATLELDAVRRPWKKAQAILIGDEGICQTPSGIL